MGTIRTFIAIDIAPVIKAAATKQIRELQKFVSDYRWVDVPQMHITLKFLGNVLDREIPDLCRKVEGAVQESPIFDVGFCGLGAFPAPDRPRVLWMGIDDPEGEFSRLSRRLDQALADMGFQPEKRDFKAHLTLGRCQTVPRRSRALEDYFERQRDVEFGHMEVDQVIIYSSFLERQGPTYTPMDTIDLRTQPQ
jgi:RNA 2',3'-cyclic 3'-phosphodiesterase